MEMCELGVGTLCCYGDICAPYRYRCVSYGDICVMKYPYVTCQPMCYGNTCVSNWNMRTSYGVTVHYGDIWTYGNNHISWAYVILTANHIHVRLYKVHSLTIM